MPRSLLYAIVAVAALGAADAEAAESLLARVFLRDGTTLACVGEYAHVSGSLVCSMPFGTRSDGQPRLQLVTLPADSVDWPRTERYRDAVHAARYAETRGEGDFALMTAQVAHTLNEIAFTDDPARKLELAVEARRRLVGWPAQHFGYRSDEVRDIVALLDEAVSDLRAASGAQSFDLDLVAMAAPPSEPLLPALTARDVVAQALAAADHVDVVAERERLLAAVLDYLDTPDAASLTPTAKLAARTFAERRLDEERRVDRAYDRLAADVSRESASRLARIDVRGLERLAATIDERDATLGYRRPDKMRGLRVAVADDLATARRVRLERQHWRLRMSAYRSYTRLIRSTLTSLDLLQGGLDDIKRLAGPDTSQLTRMATLTDRAIAQLHMVVPPADLGHVHALLRSACEMGRNAVRIRQEAVSSGSMPIAWNAAAAAAGSLMLVEQAREELGRYLKPPAAK